MSANADIVRGQYELFNRGELDRAIDDWHSDGEWLPSRGPGGLEAESYRGHEEVRRWFGEMAAAWPDFEVADLTLEDRGSKVAALCRLRGTGDASGVEIDAPLAHVWELRDGKVTRVTSYLSGREALDAVGAG